MPAVIDNELFNKANSVIHLLEEKFGKPDWKDEKSPLDELVSTILSQNTNDRNRDAAFQKLRNSFSDWEEVRLAKPEKVIDAIRTAGLANQKGPRIQAVLQRIKQETGALDLGFLKTWSSEDTRNWLESLHGVGPKTAAIVMLFTLDMPAFPVDTHIYRVTGRIGLRPKKMTVEQAHQHLEVLFPQDQYGPVHLNIIRLGREICHPRKPACGLCPLRVVCDFHNENMINEDTD